MAYPDQGPSEQPEQAPITPANPQKTYDPKQIVGEVDQKYGSWRSLKRPHEVQWFINSAMVRGLQNIKWNDTLAQLEARGVPSHKLRPAINKILPKYRQRKAKFLKNRYSPIVVPASSDKEDKMNATASQAALEYASRKNNLERVYRDALDWSLITGKGFIWLHWDDNTTGMAKGIDGQPVELPIGDIIFETGSPFEILVPDMGVKEIGAQHEIMRVRAIPLEELKLRYKNVPGINDLKGDTSSDDMFQYQKQIATLSAKSNVGLLGGVTDKSDRDLQFVVRKELFSRPCAKYPNGRYAVVANGMLLKYQEVLPYGFKNMPNPYPVVEFPDIELAGQFWPTSTVEQLVGPQREYNELRQKLINHLNKQSHPKVIVHAMSKWPENAWTDEAGEVIRIIAMPGVMEPKIVTPPPISQDLWHAMDTIRGEMDEISSLPPVVAGEAASTTSGFQVNLLQEATDSVHSPDVRAHELAFEELYKKARRIMAQGYDQPRLINIAGRSHIPDVREFSSTNIDENAEVIVYTGTALSNSPAVRTQQVIELWNAGLLQDDMNPAEGKRKALTMLDNNGIGEFQEEKKRDEEKARLENLSFSRGELVKPPLPFDDHVIHYTQHTDQMKTPEFDLWDDAAQKELFVHSIMHMKFINPQAAISTALELGLVNLIPFLMPPQMPGAPPPTEGQPEQSQESEAAPAESPQPQPTQ